MIVHARGRSLKLPTPRRLEDSFYLRKRKKRLSGIPCAENGELTGVAETTIPLAHHLIRVVRQTEPSSFKLHRLFDFLEEIDAVLYIRCCPDFLVGLRRAQRLEFCLFESALFIPNSGI